MSNIAIRVENLSKKYLIGSGTSGSLRETLNNTWHKTFGGKRTDVEEFWALNDISFEIKQGEAVGIIGKNGAGKSTLLKVLSKITYPTSGKITMNGRVSSLLEVGTGFHPELTGKENIFLNGTILGMSRKEVKNKFDEIVEFSGVGKFLDTPVKRYSSGMYVRLAFAVAAHLEPEILIIDEVLAVGDAEFQKKCLGKMENVAKGGRTVLFVSHNMGAILGLCERSILLKKGNISFNGKSQDAINEYNLANNEVLEIKRKDGDQSLTIDSISINDQKNQLEISIFEKIIIKIHFTKHLNKHEQAEFFLIIKNSMGEEVISIFQNDSSKLFDIEQINNFVSVQFDCQLKPGQYTVSAGIFNEKRKFIDWVDNLFLINVLSTFSDGRLFDSRLGNFYVKGNWNADLSIK